MARLHQVEDISHILFGDGLSAPDQGEQALHRLDGVNDLLSVLSCDLEPAVPAHHSDAQVFFNELDVFVQGAEEADSLLHPLHADGLFDQIPISPSYSDAHLNYPAGTNRPSSSRHSAVRVTVSAPSRRTAENC